LIRSKTNRCPKFSERSEKQLIKSLRILNRTSKSLWKNAVRGFVLPEILS
jgi:hypothetical protein